MRKSPLNELTLKFPSLSSNESLSRAVTAAFSASANPTIEELADVKCAVSEAVTNCIVHAYKGTCGPVEITFQLLENRLLRIAVKDKGCGIENVHKAMEPLYTTDAAGERSGMGFAVMENFMDSLRVSSTPGKGTKVIMTKRLSPLTHYSANG